MVIFEYPEHSNVKSKLYELSDQDNVHLSQNLDKLKPKGIVGGDLKWRSGLEYRKTNKEVDTLLKWIESLVPYVAHGLSRRGCKPSSDIKYLDDAFKQNPVEFGGGDEFGFDPFGFTLYECWFVYYRKENELVPHDHFPYPITFVYYINCPEGSAPLILNGEEHIMKEGQLIFFNGHDEHAVPTSEVDGRAVMTGCIAYDRARE